MVVGHLTHFFPLSRPALSSLQAVYGFINSADLDEWRPLGREIVAELKVALGLCRPYLSRAYCSDASGRGYALHVAHSAPAELRAVGAWRERWRFREVTAEADPVQGLPGAAAGVLAAALEDPAPVFTAWMMRQVESQPTRRSARTPIPDAPPRCLVEMPEALPALPGRLVPGRWRRVLVGAWHEPSQIHLQEARIALVALRRESREVSAHGHSLVSLGDNQAEVLSHDRGRARDHGLNALCTRAAAFQLGCGMQWRRRYCKTDRNPSDGDSRLADRGLLKPGEVLRPA